MVALVLVAAGLLFATSARTADGSDLRGDGGDLRALVIDKQRQVAERARTLDRLRAQVEAQASRVDDPAAETLRRRSDALAALAGLTPVSGPGLQVRLDDAPADPLDGTGAPPSVSPDVLIVHQQDLQAVVNALWSGGAQAVQLQDQRLIATSAVRCVGNTLKLQGRLYAPPYTVRAVGDPASLRRALDASPDVQAYLTDVQRVGLGWDLTTDDQLTVKAASNPVPLQHASTVGARPSGSGSSGGH